MKINRQSVPNMGSTRRMLSKFRLGMDAKLNEPLCSVQTKTSELISDGCLYYSVTGLLSILSFLGVNK